jgi:hypothetical protein
MENIKIRKHTFESNSSSSHTIFISEEVLLLDTSLLPNQNGDLILDGGEFGWEWERYNDAITKANYAAISSSGVDRNMLEEVLKEQTGAKNIIFNFSEDWNEDYVNHAYIDHDSTGNLGEKITNEESLKNYIFNPNCWLITGNDNSDGPNQIFDFPITKEDGQIIPFKYTFEIKVKGVQEELKFGEIIDHERIFDNISNALYDKNFNLFNSAENSFNFESYSLKGFFKHHEVVDLENKFIILFSNSIIDNDVRELFDIKLNKSNLLVEKNNEKCKYPEKLDWRVQSKLKKELMNQNIEKYIIRLPIEIIDLV